MELPQAWFPDLETEDQELTTYDEMKNLYDIVDNVNIDSYSSENIYQSFQIQEHEVKPPEPLLATTVLSSNSLTLSFGNPNPKHKAHQFRDSLGYEAVYTTDVETTSRYHLRAQDQALAERKRREKLNQHIISLSALLPNLKKRDKVSVLKHASNYIIELQGRVKELEGLAITKRKDVQECVISMKRSRVTNSDDEYTSSKETESREGTDHCKLSPEIEVQISGSSVIVRIQCQKNISSLVNILTQMQKLGLSIISSSALPFAETTVLITIVAQIEANFSMTTKELVKSLQLAI